MDKTMSTTTIKITQNKVSFGMFWQCYGRQEIELPEHVDKENKEAVIAYIKSVWADVPIPVTEDGCVEGSDELDEESEIYTYSYSKEEDCMMQEEGNIRVEWVDDDEGLCGDYNPDDPEDVHLLRFDVSVKRGGVYKEVEDASYCTRMPADTDQKTLLCALKYLLKEYSVLRRDPKASVKKLGERLSWICPEWFVITPDMIREGISRGLVRFVKDPQNMWDPGTVCQIGEHWFYFGGPLAAEYTPEEYVKAMDSDSIVTAIIEALDEFEGNDMKDEYEYYRLYLLERLRKGA